MHDRPDRQPRHRGQATSPIPLLEGSVGPDVIDIRKLYGETGKFTYDPGFTSTAVCQSAITYIDGDEGILLHRGYPIDQLAEQSIFMEVAYLLLHGDLPSKAELDEFTYTITPPHDGPRAAGDLLPRVPPRRASDGDHVRRGRRAVAPSITTCTDITDPQQRLIASHRLIAKMPTLAAMAYKYSIGQPFLYPQERPQLHRQFPAHDLRRPGRAL